MSVTVNTFPPFQAMNSPRSWALAIIAVLHLGFFWLLTSGMGTRMVAVLVPTTSTVVPVAQPKVPIKREPRTDVDVEPLRFPRIHVPRPENAPEEQAEKKQTTPEWATGEPVGGSSGSAISTEPVTELPRIDSQTPLSEPEYPATEIRHGHEGTVMLSIFVLENGRIGDVKIEQSSGYSRLDAAAQREARRWRLAPGTHAGRPVAMWKTIPITFRLKK